MLFNRYGTFAGGIDLPDEKDATLDKAILPAPRPDRLTLCLCPLGGRPAEVIVPPGRQVQAGEVVARASDAGGLDVRAPLSGRAGGVVQAPHVVQGQIALAPSLEMTELSPPETLDGVGGGRDDLDQLRVEELREVIRRGGLLTCRGRVRPLSDWVDQALAKSCRTLIVNGMENQPMVTADHRMLVEHGDDVVRGMAILARAIGVRDLVLAVDERRTGQYRRLLQATRRHKVHRIALSHKYPTGSDVLLVKVLTRRETPPGRSTMDAGSAVVDPATCLAVCHWVLAGRRQLGRVVTVSGPHAARPGNYYVPFGTPASALVGPGKGTLVHGGPMTGLACGADVPAVGPACDALLALEAPPAVVPVPCIRCGWCTDHCPARLNVAMLNDQYELNLLQAARRSGAMACVECGVCSYVCPAHLPLAPRVRQLKRAIRQLQASLPLLEGTVT